MSAQMKTPRLAIQGVSGAKWRYLYNENTS